MTTVLVMLLLFGGLEAHNFYLSNTSRGIGQLSLTNFSWLTVVLLVGAVFLVIVGVWIPNDLFQMLLDGDSVTDSNVIPFV